MSFRGFGLFFIAVVLFVVCAWVAFALFFKQPSAVDLSDGQQSQDSSNNSLQLPLLLVKNRTQHPEQQANETMTVCKVEGNSCLVYQGQLTHQQASFVDVISDEAYKLHAFLRQHFQDAQQACHSEVNCSTEQICTLNIYCQ